MNLKNKAPLRFCNMKVRCQYGFSLGTEPLVMPWPSVSPDLSPIEHMKVWCQYGFSLGTEPLVMPWPSLSPDLSPIEHIWDEFDRGVRNRARQPQMLRHLKAVLQAEWIAMPQVRLQNVIRSICQRCLDCTATHVGHTCCRLGLSSDG